MNVQAAWLGALVFPAALQFTVAPFNVPWAVPETFKSFAHVALKDPLALVDVCSLAFHLKSVHDEGEGTLLADAHVPISALTPPADGLVVVLVCSKPMQPAAATAAASASARIVFSWHVHAPGARLAQS